MSIDREHDPELKDRVGRLLEFLRELVRARTKPVRNLSVHEHVFWLDAAESAALVNSDAAHGEVALRAPRTSVDPPPGVPAALREWVDAKNVTSSAAAGPSLRPSGPVKGWTQRVDRDDPAAAAVRAELERYRRSWDEWALLDRVRRPRHDAYQALQRCLNELSSRPESVELVVAAGLLNLAGSEPVRTHLVTQQAVVEKDPQTGDLLCRLVPDSRPRLEDTQLLTGLEVFDATGSRVLQESLATQCTSPLSEGLPAVLKEWAGRAVSIDLDVRAERSQAISAPGRLSASPALVLRRRGSFALVEYYEQMIAAASMEGAAVPLGIAQLVEAIEPADRLAWLERTGATAAIDLADDPLFPLPANGEQREILERLGRDSGVVVEGPPGTGKTHTIANLVSALLARGQRVLVTSEKSQALRVLREKLPPEMQELCVSITDVARGGSDELNKSVATLASRKSTFQEKTERARINDLEQKRRRALGTRAGLLEDIRALRESETYQHPEVAPGFGGTAATIVRALNDGRDEHDWLPAPVRTPAPPLDPQGLQRLRELLGSVEPSWPTRRLQSLPDLLDVLPTHRELLRWCDHVQSDPDVDSVAASPLLQTLAAADGNTLLEVTALCRELEGASNAVLDAPPWVVQAADSILRGDDEHLWNRASSLPDLVERATRADQEVGAASVESAAPIRAARVAYDALAAHLHEGGTWKRVLKSDQQKAVEALGELATVDGQPATTAELATTVTHHLAALDAVSAAASTLEPLAIPVPAQGSRPVQVNGLVQVEQRVRRAHEVLQARDALRSALAALTPSPPRMRTVTDAVALCSSAGDLAARHSAQLARAQLEATATRVEAATVRGASPESIALATAVRAADPTGVEDARRSLEAARREQQLQEELDTLDEQLGAGSPGLVGLLRTTASDESWPARIDSIAAAWSWRCAMSWMEHQATPGRELDLETRLATVDSDIAQLTTSVASARAWRDCLQRMTASQVQALQAYRDNTTNVGMGTGKYAERFRSAARDAMREAQGAVPAWVMPLQQVLASIPPQPGAFDVVIVDEASQADISSLFLLWLAPRVIVVGDDKQCTPSEVSAGALDDVFTRLETYLPDMPEYLRSTLTPRSSVFSMLRTRFGQVVRLREHFRCMPEIITWSSQQFYRDAPLVPVRQHGADRLPPLRTTCVPDAYVEGANARLANRVEAAAIVDTIEECLLDEAYDGKTFGVVVLQGQSQVDVIRNALLQRIGQDEWDSRRLRVGTPPDFQGDERHVILLSMVVAPEQRFASLTKNEYQRRFNVAASRAQDQLWLFHSVTVDRLANSDLRRSLLTYMSSASAAPATPMPPDITRDRRQTPFESLFEQRVFLDIAARGYHVNPQVEVNNRRLDLVVTGAGAKLAVECDGDAWHSSSEQLQNDLDRELELKRCGWEFWRVRESEYYLDPERALSTLWTSLDDRGISPLSLTTMTSTGSAVPWIPAVLPDDESLAEDLLPDALTDVVASTVAAETELFPLPDPPPLLFTSPTDMTPAALLESSPKALPDEQELAAPIDELPAASVPESVATPSRPERSVRQERVLSAAVARPVTTVWVRENLHLDPIPARELLNGLVAQGALERHGQTKGTYYVLPGSTDAFRQRVAAPARPAPIRPAPRPLAQLPAADLETAVEVARAASWSMELDIALVRRLTGLSLGPAEGILRQLVDAGEVEAISTPAGAVRYRRPR